MPSSLHLDFVSPLPPVRSGIADYSADLLPDLAQLCDVRVIRLDDQPVADELVQKWAPVGADRLAEDGRLPLYQMGNNSHHEQVFELALETPGVVTLHDIFLHHLTMERFLTRQQLEPYKAQLEFDHGWIGAAVALPPRWGAYGDSGLFSLPCHRSLVQRQRGVLVHSQWGADLVKEESGIPNVRVIPMPMPLEEPAADAAIAEFRSRHGIPAETTVLGSFGFQTPIKRTDVVVRALAQPGMESLHLLVVGQVARELDLESEAREVGVLDRVHVLGYVDREELRVAMSVADIALNLRYPTAGETSASLLRLFAQGCPAIVSEYAQFADLPADVALQVPLGRDEVELLALRVRDVLASPDSLREMGAAARKLIQEEHAPRKAAAAVYEACRDLAAEELPPSEPAAPPLPTTLTWGPAEGSVTVRGLDEPWPPGSARELEIHLANTGRARWLAAHRGVGGVSLKIELEDLERDHLQTRSWVPLPVDLQPGEQIALSIRLRRPLGPCTLRVVPQVAEAEGYSALDGPTFEQRVF